MIGGAVAPLGVVGVWTARVAERAGEDLLRVRLDSTLAHAARDIGGNWVRQRSGLLALAEADTLRRTLQERGAGASPSSPLPVAVGAAGVPTNLLDAVVRDRHGRERWRLQRHGPEGTPGWWPVAAANDDATEPTVGSGADGVRVSLAIHDGVIGEQVGQLEVRLRTAALWTGSIGAAGGVGAVLAVVDRPTGVSLMPLPFDPALLERERFTWGGEPWLAMRRRLEEPTVDLVAAAPLLPYQAPFERAAAQGTLVLALVACAGVVVAMLVTRRLTRSLEELASAADAVARGELDRRVEARGGDEVARVAAAFNAMTENLRRTIGELSQRRALSAVGE